MLWCRIHLPELGFVWAQYRGICIRWLLWKLELPAVCIFEAFRLLLTLVILFLFVSFNHESVDPPLT
jgi:hypothetical protein